MCNLRARSITSGVYDPQSFQATIAGFTGYGLLLPQAGVGMSNEQLQAELHAASILDENVQGESEDLQSESSWHPGLGYVGWSKEEWDFLLQHAASSSALVPGLSYCNNIIVEQI